MLTILETKMQSKLARITITILILNIAIIVFTLLARETIWLINAEVGFASALAVIFASLWSYRQMVQASTKSKETLVSNNIEDSSRENQENDEPQDKVSTFEALKQNRAYISLYRLGAYLLLAVGFAMLNQQGLLHIPSYFGGIFLALLAVIFGLRQKEKKEVL